MKHYIHDTVVFSVSHAHQYPVSCSLLTGLCPMSMSISAVLPGAVAGCYSAHYSLPEH